MRWHGADDSTRRGNMLINWQENLGQIILTDHDSKGQEVVFRLCTGERSIQRPSPYLSNGKGEEKSGRRSVREGVRNGEEEKVASERLKLVKSGDTKVEAQSMMTETTKPLMKEDVECAFKTRVVSDSRSKYS
ncbi:hypothetical protein ACLOJK_000519 [Asimina triloba]